MLSANIAVVIERRTPDGRAAQLNGLEERERCELARAPDLPHNVQKLCRGFLRLEFVRHCPLGKFIRITELFAYSRGVDL